MDNNNRSKKLIIPIVAVAALAVIAIVAFVVIRGNNLSASTMRMLRTEGVVKLFEQEKEKSITKNLRLNAGNVLNTEDASLAGIALDDTKIVTVDEKSSIKVDQKGKKLDVNLTSGSLYFEVTQKLSADETFDIRTSTMVVGIRGTSGYVAVDQDGHDVVMITDGEVVVTGTNPVTGEQKTITVKAGQQVKAYLYNDRTVDSIMFELEDVVEEDLDVFVVDRLKENDKLIDLVCGDTGWSKEKILGLEGKNAAGDAQLAQEPAEIPDETTASSDGSQEVTENNTIPEPEAVASGDAPAADGGSDNSGNGNGNNNDNNDAAPAEPAPAVTDETVEKATAAAKSVISENVASVDEATGVMKLKNGSTFDPAYYAAQNPDVAGELGNDPEKLLEHYLAFGASENRYGTAAEATQAAKEKQTEYEKFVNAVNQASALAAEEEAKRAASQSHSSGGSSNPEGGEDGGNPDPNGKNDPWSGGQTGP